MNSTEAAPNSDENTHAVASGRRPVTANTVVTTIEYKNHTENLLIFYSLGGSGSGIQ